MKAPGNTIVARLLRDPLPWQAALIPTLVGSVGLHIPYIRWERNSKFSWRWANAGLLTIAEIRELSLNGRNMLDLLAIVPGVMPESPDDAIAYCTTILYSRPMKKITKPEMPFTEVRQNLTAILEDVQKSCKPVTILKRGKPAAVIIPHDMYEEKITRKKPPFKLAGSFKVAPGVDIDEVLAKAKQERIELWQKRMKRPLY